jgi:hypothetical protein
MAFNPKFYLGANKFQVADALNPFQHLQRNEHLQFVSIVVDKDDTGCHVSVPRQELEEIKWDGNRSQHQDESDSKSEEC